MKTKHLIAALAALTVSAYADFTSVADLATNNAGYKSAVQSGNLPEQAAYVLGSVYNTSSGRALTSAEFDTYMSREDVQSIMAAAVPVILSNPSLTSYINYEGVVRAWLKTTAGKAWAAGNSAQVSAYLSNSTFQHIYLLNDYSSPEKFATWKASGYARPLGEVVRPEAIAFVAGSNGDWDAITVLDRSSFTYDVFGYDLYSRWAKAQAKGKTPKDDYDFLQKELVNVGMAGTAGSLPIVEHLGKLSQLLFNTIRQNSAIQTP